jgi:hypothetical protein
MIRIESIADPFTRPALAVKGARALALVDAMGLLSPKERRLTLEASTFARLLPRLQRVGLGGGITAFLSHAGFRGEPDMVEKWLDQLTDALEASPVPAAEWKQLNSLLGLDLLARLLGTSAVSVRRYARAARTTPDDVAARLHWLALIVGDLAGAYNELGIRQWFDRKRAQLGGRTPAQMLHGTWRPDEAGPQQVRALAHALTGSPAT